MKRLLVLSLCTLLGAGLLAAAGTTSASAASFAVKATFNKRTVVLGQSLWVSGTVAPKPQTAKTRVVYVQQFRGGRWVNLKRTGVAANGRFGTSITPSGPGNAYYRVYKTANGARKAGVSRTGAVNVYKWHYLWDLEQQDGDSFYESDDPISINGTSYKKSIYGYLGSFNDSGYLEYNLSRKCSILTGVIGLDDGSDTGASANLEMLGDGNRLYSQDYGLGQSNPVRLAVSNVLRIRFEATKIAPDLRAFPTVGSPRVLCKF